MSSIGKISANLISAVNENTLALASAKFDFSLIKVEAPAEFSGLGEALSVRRRNEAEDGTSHRTARRLAALFEQLVPSTPKLITAYGLRSSEIIKTPGINPRSSPVYGPFETFVGADGTAMWAAATSGIPALGVYLLACLLARAWDAKEAISVWVELVEHRRAEIEDGSKNNHAVSDSSRMSVHQIISRDELARWDASARAWLRSADQAKVKEQTQLTLIIKNSQLPFNGGPTTYRKVVEAWQQAMTCLESLLCGRPQAISNKSILLAFSAWHLYPNLIWLGSDIRNVDFHDPYVDPRGTGTIALEPGSATATRSTSWSLALSHLRYYGRPVTAESSTDFSRVNIQQLHIVALGSITYLWRISQRDIPAVMQWFVQVWSFLDQNATEPALEGLDWLKYLAQAAKVVQISIDCNEPSALQLLRYGQRRGKHFLSTPHADIKPFFGLAYDSILVSLSEQVDEERAIAYMRAVAKWNEWHCSEAFIGCNQKPSADWTSVLVQEFMTAVPHLRGSRKRNFDGKAIDDITHARWIHVERCPRSYPVSDDYIKSALCARFEELHNRGEYAMQVNDRPSRVRNGDVVWADPPLLYKYPDQSAPNPSNSGHGTNTYECLSGMDVSVPCRCLEPTGTRTSVSAFEPVDRIGAYTLFLKRNPTSGFNTQHKDMDLADSIKRLQSASIDANIVSTYLRYLVEPRAMMRTREDDYISDEDEDQNHEHRHKDFKQKSKDLDHKKDFIEVTYLWEIASKHPMTVEHSWSLIALVLATKIYHQLEGAGISLKIIDKPLSTAPWLPKKMQRNEARTIEGILFCAAILPATLERLHILSCITQLESGTLLLPPKEFDQTLAIASGNSIFVIGILISDPFDIEAGQTVKRIVGNIGRSGICLLIAPTDPQIRPLGHQYNLVTHAAYDGKREDNFPGTSLHLSFTDWTLPLEVEGLEARTIDQEAYFVESVISVLDSGKWVADLDILCIDFGAIIRLEMDKNCPGHPEGFSDFDHTSIDSWEELLDQSTCVGFFRAHGNWAARLAAVSIMCQKGQAHSVGILGPEHFCLDCLCTMHDDRDLERFESPLPSICID